MANVVEIGTRTSIERQARKWLIRMDSDDRLSNTEKKALSKWMSRSVLHRRELTRIAKFWDQANILTEVLAGLESEGRQSAVRRGGSWGWPILMAVAFAAVSSVVFVYCHLQQLSETDALTYGTAIGQQKTIVLSDGSSMLLNTNSEVRVSHGNGVYKIHLIRGEARFCVTPAPGRAFEVFAADSIVRTVGTEFVVRLEGRKVDVTVEKGAVELSDLGSTGSTVGQASIKAVPLASKPSRLRAGEGASFESGSGHIEVHQITETELRRRMSWQEGYLAFSDEPLSEVVTQLNRYSTTTLVIGDPKIASIAIGGRFRIGNADALLNLLSKTIGIRAREVDDHTILLEFKGER